MNGVALMMAAAAIGVDYGWQPAADGRCSAEPGEIAMHFRARWNSRRTVRVLRMNGVGSTAVTSAPRLAATTVPAPIPAPMSTTRSPGLGSTKAITASLISDRHISGACRR